MRKQRRRSAVQLLDQLCSKCTADGKCTADHCLCFRFSDSTVPLLLKFEKSSVWPFFCDCTGRFVSDLVRNPKDRFSRVMAYHYGIKCLLSEIVGTCMNIFNIPLYMSKFSRYLFTCTAVYIQYNV